MPSAQWAMKDYHRKWYAGETISVGIGQGAVQATPLQLARIIGGTRQMDTWFGRTWCFRINCLRSFARGSRKAFREAA